VVCPSVKPEAFGRIAIEAQASSRIIIATKIGGSLETIIDGETGFLIEVGEVEKFAELIDEVLDFSQEHAKTITSKARQHVEEKFSNEKMCGETIAVYRSLLSAEQI
jgi:glycosyltransferase involved in cell wall biosynthesis